MTKRILALSGGGVRGIVEVAFLERVERAYREHFGANIRLCDVFDLMGGSSTGALIATALSLGHPLDQIRHFYLERAKAFFSRRRWWAAGQVPFFDSAGLEAEIKSDIGDLTLGSDAFETYLAIVTKRLDTGSPWIATNIPSAPYFDDPDDGSYVGNRHYPVSKLLRASTAAPTLFAQELLEIADTQDGVFVDGGLTPYNDPSVALLQLARMQAFGLNWHAGAGDLYILSIGTGRFRQRLPTHIAARMGPLRTALQSLKGMMTDCEEHALTLMHWLGQTTRPVLLNSEIGDLGRETLAPDPLFSFLRLDLPLEVEPLKQAGMNVSERHLRGLRRMDDPRVIDPIYALACEYADATISTGDILNADPGTRQSSES